MRAQRVWKVNGAASIGQLQTRLDDLNKRLNQLQNQHPENWKMEELRSSALGLSREQLDKQLYVVDPRGRISGGYRACKQLVIYNPALWLVVTPVLAAVTRWGHGDGVGATRLVCAVGLIALLPVFEPVGEVLYRVVARNRYRLGSPECEI